MVVLIVLLVSWLAFRAVGAAGVHPLASWQDSARYALVVMFFFTATAHFNKMKHDLARMIPAYFPHPLLIVYITGVFELLCRLSLLSTVTAFRGGFIFNLYRDFALIRFFLTLGAQSWEAGEARREREAVQIRLGHTSGASVFSVD
jgi:hypothetical protein